MSNTRNIDLKSLNDTENYKGVSPETRTAIIGAIGIDVEGLTTEEGGKFTEDELVTGLRYLLVNNKELHSYIEKSDTSLDMFSLPLSHDMTTAVLLNNAVDPHHAHTGHGCPDCGSGDCEAIIIVLTIAAACACCIVTGYNSSQTLQSSESNRIKTLKMLATVLSFLIPAGITFPIALKLLGKDESYSYINATCISIIVGATSALFMSLLNRIECANQADEAPAYSPSPEVLAELETIKGILQGNYRKDADNPEEFRKFVQDVVRYYIHKIAKSPSLDAITETTPLLYTASNPVRLFSPPPKMTVEEIKPQEEMNTPALAASF